MLRDPRGRANTRTDRQAHPSSSLPRHPALGSLGVVPFHVTQPPSLKKRSTSRSISVRKRYTHTCMLACFTNPTFRALPGGAGDEGRGGRRGANNPFPQSPLPLHPSNGTRRTASLPGAGSLCNHNVACYSAVRWRRAGKPYCYYYYYYYPQMYPCIYVLSMYVSTYVCMYALTHLLKPARGSQIAASFDIMSRPRDCLRGRLYVCTRKSSHT